MIILFYNDFTLVVSSPDNVYYNNQLPVVQQYFTNIVAIQNVGVLQQIWHYEIIGCILLMCQNTTMQVYGAWIKIYGILCSKTSNIASFVL